MATDPFGFKAHRSKDLDRATALDQAKILRDASTRYGQASRVLGMTGLRLSKKETITTWLDPRANIYLKKS